ncbi:hypothetical protein T07_7287 [Trichinella nelsoni]|uniref:Uncharacterized protein n=1 Tax=Trichinella nelsoni TaxID=6336 RepID=A0A0V0RDZ7_9BILA|nr:hypothetical protein T07_7287 [Trichinella nelsoni]
MAENSVALSNVQAMVDDEVIITASFILLIELYV